MQDPVFPSGIFYDRETDSYRTLEVNTIFAIIASLPPYREGIKKAPDNSGALKDTVSGERRTRTQALAGRTAFETVLTPRQFTLRAGVAVYGAKLRGDGVFGKGVKKVVITNVEASRNLL